MPLIALLAATLALPALRGEHVTQLVHHNYGGFAFVEERHDLPPRELEPLHGPADHWFELHLEYRIEGTEIALVDDGAKLDFHISSPECQTSSPYQSYRGRTGEPHLFAMLLEVVALHYRACPGSTPASVRSAIASVRGQRESFGAGVEAMKARAGSLFHGWRQRCRPRPQPRRGPVIFVPDPHSPCPNGEF